LHDPYDELAADLSPSLANQAASADIGAGGKAVASRY
jgi:hypothetical protein